MSWNNALPWYIYDLEREYREAKMLCGMGEEINAGRLRSTPSHWYALDERMRQEDAKLYSLGVNLLETK